MLELLKEQDVLGKKFMVYGTWESPLFLAKDVAEWIEYSVSNTSKLLDNIEEEEKALVQIVREDGSTHKQWFLTEEGLYEVLMQSRKPIAKEFKKQVKLILKEIRTEGTYQSNQLSPQLQLLISMELEQKRLAETVDTHTKQISSICEVVALDTRSWRTDAKEIIKKIAMTLGGFDYIKEVQTEIYQLLETRGGVSLSTRLTNKRRRMAEEGTSKTKRDKLNKLDIVAEDKKLIEIYVAIVKEMAIAKGVVLANSTALVPTK